MAENLRHEPALSRYLLERDGEVIGLADYRVKDDGIQVTHTEVDPSLRGQGLGSVLVRGVLDDLRTSTDARIVPICPFVDDWIGLHPDYQDLLTR